MDVDDCASVPGLARDVSLPRDSGVEARRLPVSRVARARGASTATVSAGAAFRATVELTRSGGFGLVVLDLGPGALDEKLEKPARRYRKTRAQLSIPFITKLVGIAQKTATAVVVLTEKTRESSSLNSLISLRCEARRNPERPCEVEIDVLKDKRRGPGRRYREVCRAPAGLR